MMKVMVLMMSSNTVLIEVRCKSGGDGCSIPQTSMQHRTGLLTVQFVPEAHEDHAWHATCELV